MRTILLAAIVTAALLALAVACGDGQTTRFTADEPTLRPCETDEREDPPPRVTPPPIGCVCEPRYAIDPAQATLLESQVPRELLQVDSPTYGDRARSPLRVTGRVSAVNGWISVSIEPFFYGTVSAENGSHRVGEPGVLSPFEIEVPFTLNEDDVPLDRRGVACVTINEAGSPHDAREVARIPVYLLPN